MRLYEGETMKKYSVVICGGGSTYTPDMIELLCMMQRDFPLKKVVLYDNDEERQRPVGEFGKIMFSEYYPGLEFKYTLDKEEAFKDIDFAFVQIRAGGMEQRNNDEKIPYKYGVIGQETCGPGGLAYGVRSVVQMVELVEDIRKYSKDAWIINYSNPAAIVAEATKRKFPDDKKLVNICDMPTSVLDAYLPLISVKRSQIYPRYFGLNHLGGFTGIYYKKSGHDYLPELLDYVKNNYDDLHKQFEEKIKGPDDHWGITFLNHLEMMHDFPYSLPNTYNLYYLYNGKTLGHYSVDHTRYDEVVKGRETMVFDYCKKVVALGKMKGTEYDISSRINPDYEIDNPQAASTVYADNDVHAAYLVELVLSIINNDNSIGLVMTKNNGICPNLDSGMMLEVACRVGAQEIVPLNYGEVPQFEKGLLENQYACEKLLVDAIFEQSDQKLLQAFTENRVVRDADLAKKLIKDFKEANGKYWPEFK